jgi:hypothetical protein
MASKKQDPWEYQWTVHDNQGAGGNNLGNGTFSLVWNGQGGYYQVTQQVGMPPVPNWSQLQFFPHGENPLNYTGAELPKWDDKNPNCKKRWLQAANDRRSAARLKTRRLVAGYPGHDILLIRIDGAVVDGTPLLLLQQIPIETDLNQGGGHIRQDGTAHGGH